VVVHPGTDETDLRLGVGVAPGQRRQPSGSARGRPRRSGAGICSKSSSAEETPIASSISRRSSGVAEV
jgi:hypothetical protein